MESPRKQNTSKVIETLQSTIDGLRQELALKDSSLYDYKNKCGILLQKNTSLIDLLTNSKHDNEITSALLKRKERRITDLETLVLDLTISNESLTLNNKNLRIRADNLLESSSASISELERLKISYDALISSQKEYKKYYQLELESLGAKVDIAKSDIISRFETVSSSSKDVDALLDSLTSKRKAMDLLYFDKNNKLLLILKNLATLAKTHGEDSKLIVDQNLEVLRLIIKKNPEFSKSVSDLSLADISLDDFILDTQQSLESVSFDEPEGVEKLESISNSITSRRKKNKRNSIRFDSKSAYDFNDSRRNSLRIDSKSNYNFNDSRRNSIRTDSKLEFSETSRDSSREYKKSEYSRNEFVKGNDYKGQNDLKTADNSHNSKDYSRRDFSSNSINLPKRSNVNKVHTASRMPTPPSDYENFSTQLNQKSQFLNSYSQNQYNYNQPHSQNYYANQNTHNSAIYNNSGYMQNPVYDNFNNQTQSVGINVNANNFNKYNHINANYKHNRNSSYNPIPQNQNNQSKQMKRRSYSTYNNPNYQDQHFNSLENSISYNQNI